MKKKHIPRKLLFSERLYRTLLLLYPADHRRDYGPLMVQLFRDMGRDALEMGGVFGLVKLWLRTIPDIATTTIDEHLEKKGTNLMTDIPAKIGRYEIKEALGISAATNIYRAVDPETGRDVAVKMARPQIDEPDKKKTGLTEKDVREWMKREAELLTKLDHPTIPKCYGYFEEQDSVYVVMDFIKGKDLLARLEEHDGCLPEKEVIGWSVQLCDFLIYMHNRKPKPLIFRDMKPANILIDPDGRVYIVDFGIADWAAGFGLTLLGTIGYSPPEQYAGKSDARSDIFALGATLYHVLTGRDPHKEHHAFLFHAFPPRSLNPALSKKLEAVILKAVEHKAEDRYQSAEEMKAALLACA
jgi:eukaryotic-like serine/threonine-protein kinase